MHELGLCASIVDAIEQHAGDRDVARVRIRVGRLNHVHPEAFDQSFTIAATGTVAEQAAADLVLLPIRAHCQGCGRDLESDEILPTCPHCGSASLDITGGDELMLESIEYRA